MQFERQFEDLELSRSDSSDTILTQRLNSTQPCRVMVVDDDDLVRARLASLLRASEYEVEVADSGKEALRIMNQEPCQVLLTDWQMPDMDGLTLCQTVRAGQNESYVYVLMFTVRDRQEDLMTGLAAGADDYLVKGAPVEEIMARLQIARRITHVEQSLRVSNRENWRLSVTDPLTGANNLRYLMKYLPRELARSRRYGNPLAILSCDIDGFKRINDCFGHEAGNELLRAFVARSESCLRQQTDWIARVGGDEFMIVLPETKVSGAHRVANKLRQAYVQTPVTTHAGPVTFTASVGVTALDLAHDSEDVSRVEHLLRAADRGLYVSKSMGGNRVTDSAICLDEADTRTGAKNETN